MRNTIAFDRHRTVRLFGALAAITVSLAACTETAQVVTQSIPDDYRLRHPIAVQEADHSIVVFVGRGRGALTAPERADILALAHSWLGEGTGAIVADVPVNTPNARAAASTSTKSARCWRRVACRRAE